MNAAIRTVVRSYPFAVRCIVGTRLRSNIHQNGTSMSMMLTEDHNAMKNINSASLSSSSADLLLNSAGFWYAIQGFSKFASRHDLNFCLADIKPQWVDPILDSGLYPMGKWAICFEDSRVVEILNLQLQERMSKRISCIPLDTTKISFLRTASRYGISDRTVRIRFVHRDVGEDEMRFFLEDYELAEAAEPQNRFINFKAVDMLTRRNHVPQKFNDFLVHFKTAAEAERCVQEKNFSTMQGYDIQMLWYCM